MRQIFSQINKGPRMRVSMYSWMYWKIYAKV